MSDAIPKSTLKDVAAEAGVSKTVVSWVYHGKAERNRVSAETQRRVAAVIARRGYAPAGADKPASAAAKPPDSLTTLLATAGYRFVPGPAAGQESAGLVGWVYASGGSGQPAAGREQRPALASSGAPRGEVGSGQAAVSAVVTASQPCVAEVGRSGVPGGSVPGVVVPQVDADLRAASETGANTLAPELSAAEPVPAAAIPEALISQVDADLRAASETVENIPAPVEVPAPVAPPVEEEHRTSNIEHSTSNVEVVVPPPTPTTAQPDNSTTIPEVPPPVVEPPEPVPVPASAPAAPEAPPVVPPPAPVVVVEVPPPAVEPPEPVPVPVSVPAEPVAPPVVPPPTPVVAAEGPPPVVVPEVPVVAEAAPLETPAPEAAESTPVDGEAPLPETEQKPNTDGLALI